MYKGEPVTMWSLIPMKKIPPTRLIRYCCEVLKEQGGKNRAIATGVRWGESRARSKRGIYETQNRDKNRHIIINNDNDEKRRWFERCKLQAKTVINPIIDWTDAEIWDYIRAEKIQVNPLYQCGFSRVGCIGCPMAGTKGRQREFAKYPKYQKAYIRAFDHMVLERVRRGKMDGTWKIGTTGIEIFHWWMEDGVIPGQMTLEDYAGLDDEWDE